jgi:hypothetical protein
MLLLVGLAVVLILLALVFWPAGDGAVVAKPTVPFLPPRIIVLSFAWLLNALETVRDKLLPPEMKIIEMVHAHWKTQALHAVTRLGVPEAIPLVLPAGAVGTNLLISVAEPPLPHNITPSYYTRYF